MDAQPLVLVNRSDVEADFKKQLDEKNFKTLVAKITGEMQAVNGNLDSIGALRKKQQDLEDAIASVTDDINSDKTKELFDEIANEEAAAPAEEVNGTLCGNATNSSDLNCTGGNETVAADGDEDAPPEEALAAVPALAAAAARMHAARHAVAAPRRAVPAAAGDKARAGAVTLARHVELFEDVARVLQDEEHRVLAPAPSTRSHFSCCRAALRADGAPAQSIRTRMSAPPPLSPASALRRESAACYGSTSA